MDFTFTEYNVSIVIVADIINAAVQPHKYTDTQYIQTMNRMWIIKAQKIRMRRALMIIKMLQNIKYI